MRTLELLAVLGMVVACHVRTPSGENGDAPAETGDGDTSTTSTSGSGAETSSTDEAGESEGGFLPDPDIWEPDLGPVDSHAEDIQPIWTQNCILYCHAAGLEPASEGLDLYDGAYDNLVGVPSTQSELILVTPADPEASYLWHKLQDTHLDVGGEGEMMPMTGVPLAEEELDRIAEWITIGAPP